MNKEYTYIDGNVIIVDDKNHKVKEEYYDNLDKVLIQENVIETMENKYLKLTKYGTKKPSNEKYTPRALFWLPTMAIGGTSPFLLPEIKTAIEKLANEFDCPIHPAIAIELFAASIGLLYSVPVEIFGYNGYKKEKGIDSQIEFLQDQIPVEKEALEKLKSIRTKEKENTDFRTVTIDDSERLNVLKSYLDLYYKLGYHGNKYYRYYQQNKLDRKLQKTFTEEGIQLAKEYLEEKGPIYSKKRVSKKN